MRSHQRRANRTAAPVSNVPLALRRKLTFVSLQRGPQRGAPCQHTVPLATEHTHFTIAAIDVTAQPGEAPQSSSTHSVCSGDFLLQHTPAACRATRTSRRPAPLPPFSMRIRPKVHVHVVAHHPSTQAPDCARLCVSLPLRPLDGGPWGGTRSRQRWFRWLF